MPVEQVIGFEPTHTIKGEPVIKVKSGAAPSGRSGISLPIFVNEQGIRVNTGPGRKPILIALAEEYDTPTHPGVLAPTAPGPSAPHVAVTIPPGTVLEMKPEHMGAILRAAVWPERNAAIGYAECVDGSCATLAETTADGDLRVKISLVGPEGPMKPGGISCYVRVPWTMEIEVVE